MQSLNQLHKLNGDIESFENKAAQIKQSIMDYMQEAEILTLENKTLATWKLPKTSYRLDSKRLTADHPELSAQYLTAVSNSRRLVIKDSKLSQ